MNPFFTVVTVCYNAEKDIKETVKSILKQKCSDYEYIVMDGASKDNTISIIHKMEKQFMKRNISCRIISEKDNGIYNAMNKAIDMAVGEWIVFINCGDALYNENTLQTVKQRLQISKCDILIGDVIIKKRGLYLYKTEQYSSLNEEIDICHQSTYTKTELLKARPYDETYRYAADREFFCHAASCGAGIDVFHYPLSVYQEGGVSASEAGRKEIEIVNKIYGIPGKRSSGHSDEAALHEKPRSIWLKLKVIQVLPRFIVDAHERKKMISKGWSRNLPERKRINSESEHLKKNGISCHG